MQELRKLTKPQNMRDALERTWDPRGLADWTRVTDASGAVFDPPRRTLAFPGATITDDPTIGDKGASVVTISGGSSGMAAQFSDDGTTTDAERAKWVAESGPAVNHMVIDTLSFGSLRFGLWVVAEDTTVLVGPAAFAQLTADDAGGTASSGIGSQLSTTISAQHSTSGSGGTTVGASSSANNGAHSASLQLATDGGLSATSSQLQATEDGVDLTYIRIEPGIVEVVADPAAYGLDVFTSSEESSLKQLGGSAAAGGATTTKRMERGPFSSGPYVLAGGATVTFTVPDCRAGTDYVVAGGIKGAAGCEAIAWSFTDNGANDVDVTLRNMDPVTSRTGTFYCNVTSTA